MQTPQKPTPRQIRRALIKAVGIRQFKKIYKKAQP